MTARECMIQAYREQGESEEDIAFIVETLASHPESAAAMDTLIPKHLEFLMLEAAKNPDFCDRLERLSDVADFARNQN